MAIHRPDVFHNTIAAYSVNAAEENTTSPEYGVANVISVSAFTETIPPKNIRPMADGYLRLRAEWLGYYLITFNATASGGTDRRWYFEPFKNGGALGYGNVSFFQQNIAGERTPFYEISSTFIAKLQKNDYIEFANTLSEEEPPEVAFQFKNIQATIYQLEQVGIH